MFAIFFHHLTSHSFSRQSTLFTFSTITGPNLPTIPSTIPHSTFCRLQPALHFVCLPNQPTLSFDSKTANKDVSATVWLIFKIDSSQGCDLSETRPNP